MICSTISLPSIVYLSASLSHAQYPDLACVVGNGAASCGSELYTFIRYIALNIMSGCSIASEYPNFRDDRKVVERCLNILGNDRLAPFLARLCKLCPEEFDLFLSDLWKKLDAPAVNLLGISVSAALAVDVSSSPAVVATPGASPHPVLGGV